MPAQAENEKRVVGLGAGFGGLAFCQSFECPSAHVTLVDRQNHHLFQPLLYQVATASPRLLPQFSPRLSAKAAARLTQLGVEVRTNACVADIRQGVLYLADGGRIDSANIVWAAGVAANPLTRELGVELDRCGRVRVNSDLSVPGHPEVFVIGDMARVHDQHDQPVPGVSPAARQMARHVAHLIDRECQTAKTNSFDRPAFRYWNKGMMATIGRSAAVAEIGRVELSGWPAWAAWLLVHLIFLVGFRNKAAVLLQWTYSYFTYKLGSRIVFGVENCNRQLATSVEPQTVARRPGETVSFADARP